LKVESEIGKGRTFSLTVGCGIKADFINLVKTVSLHKSTSFNDDAAASNDKEKKYRLSGRILIAEDNPDIHKLFTSFLTRAGATVDVAEDGLSAIEKALNTDYGLLFLDMHLPKLAACRTLAS